MISKRARIALIVVAVALLALTAQVIFSAARTIVDLPQGIKNAPGQSLSSAHGEPGIRLLAGQLGGGGDLDGSGETARFSQPRGLARDRQGNLYVADAGNLTIRKISPDGTVTTLAGKTGEKGGADGKGDNARFIEPRALAVDQEGNVYVGDKSAIRRITPTGDVTTFAGKLDEKGNVDGSASEARFEDVRSMAFDKAGNLYVNCWPSSSLRKITPSGIVTSIPILAQASDDNNPRTAHFGRFGVTADLAGNIYVADSENGTISKLSADRFTQVAGPFANPSNMSGVQFHAFEGAPVAVDKTGNFYVTDSARISRIGTDGKMVSLVGTTDPDSWRQANGVGSQAHFDRPEGFATDGDGNLYVTENTASTVRKVTPAGVATTIAGSELDYKSSDAQGANAGFAMPHGITVDSLGNLYVVETNSGRLGKIRKIDTDGHVATLASGNWLSAQTVEGGELMMVGTERNLAADKEGNIYVADAVRHTIHKVAPNGQSIIIAGTEGTPGSSDGVGSDAKFDEPTDLAVDEQSNVYVADVRNCIVRKIVPSGRVSTLAGSAGVCRSAGDGHAASFNYPSNITVDGAGNVYLTDQPGSDGNIPIRKITPDGNVSTVAVIADEAKSRHSSDGYSGHFINCLVAQRDGTLFYVDSTGSVIKRLDSNGKSSIVAGRQGSFGVVVGALPGSLSMPTSLTVDGKGVLYATVDNAVLQIKLK